jgi:hypothetical protein
MTKPTTTMLTTFEKDLETRMTGDEEFPILGSAVPKEVVQVILQGYKGLLVYWDCIKKAQIAAKILGRGEVWMGAAMVASADFQSSYGHYWNPPFEFHAWVELGDGLIFDGALPGLIQKGTETSDHIGPALVGRKPSVLAGYPLDWMRYHKIRRGEDV